MLELYKKRDDLKEYFIQSYGWVFFPTVTKIGFGVGGAGGHGEIYINNHNKDWVGAATFVGTTKLIQLSVGVQLGIQVHSELIFFETKDDYKRFISGNVEFGADMNAVALTASASAQASTLGKNQGLSAGLFNDSQQLYKTGDDASTPETTTKYSKGYAIFTAIAGGLMYEATISGQKFLPMTHCNKPGDFSAAASLPPKTSAKHENTDTSVEANDDVVEQAEPSAEN